MTPLSERGGMTTMWLAPVSRDEEVGPMSFP
jgi:hypothetical protein